MAEENEAVGEGAPKKKSPLLLILVGNIVVVGGVLGFLFFTGKLGGGGANQAPPAEEEAQQIAPVSQLSESGHTFAMKNLIVNLAGERGSRYLKIRIELEVSSEQTVKEVEQKLSMITDTIISLVTSKTYDDIQDIQGKELLKQEIVARVNFHLRTGRVKRAYFTEFVIQ